ncbi:protocadherin alpha-6-like [Amia ocellicauda]|uniref:protocadherin alpha-6-like n=1 Tax=Amia ocellicauda TaxID=2972642 RepID=UPI0034642881
MHQIGQGKTWEYRWIILDCFLMVCFLGKSSAQIRYSIAEEQKQGVIVGNIAKDIGLDISKLANRGFRIVSAAKEPILQVNQNNGDLYVNKIIDREQLCERERVCLINLKTVLEDPLEIHYVGVEVVDINDHSPHFPESEKRLEIGESTLPGARFPLEGAHDPDVGINSLRFYKLSQNEHFELEVKDRGEDNKIPILVLQKPLDRERNTEHTLLLTAYDGGNPQRSGILNITVTVLDMNDNAPVFDKDTYAVSLHENVQMGTFVIKVHASDLDDGPNAEITYSFGKSKKGKVTDVFQLDANTGEIKVKGAIDFEESEAYEIDVQATDRGQFPVPGHCTVVVTIKDLNDNRPQIEVTSLSGVISENSNPGTVIAFLSVTDLDSGSNGQVECSLLGDVPFELKPSFQESVYSLVTKSRLDRESISQYNVTVVAKDNGQPSLYSLKTIHVQLSDVNDNSPRFLEDPYSFYLSENNVPGSSVFSLSANDIDENENAHVSYRLLDSGVLDKTVSSFFNINSDNGKIYALRSFDFEEVKNIQFQVVAQDSGAPPLSSNVTVNVFILDQNDNAPVILSPLSANGSAEAVEEIPRNVNAGYIVTKVRAYDADIGYNAWLSFSLQQVTDSSLFGLDRFTGQIRTLRSLTETDYTEHKLIIEVKDNGNISLSTTATILISTFENTESFAVSDINNAAKKAEGNDVTFYLIVTLGSVSALFVISIITLIIIQCSRPRGSSKSSRDSKYIDVSGNGTLCHSIQYRAGEKRYMLVGPRMSVCSATEPRSNRNTLVFADKALIASEQVGVSVDNIQYSR